jgi:hypothetical protein
MALDPQYTTTPNVSADTETTANNVYDGTGTVGTAFTAGANGSYVGFIKLKPLGTNVASVARVWVNNGLTNATAANNFLIAEMSLPATTAVANSALVELFIPLNIPIKAGYKINFALGTTVAAGWQATVVGGDY